MQLTISNIAWRREDDAAVAELLKELGVAAIEVAPTMIWPRPLEVTEAEASAYRQWWERRGIRIVAMQALLFGQPDLQLFGSDEDRAALLQYLRGIFRLASWLGAGPLVFGSPRNRIAGKLIEQDRLQIAAAFFRRAGDAAKDAGVVLCIEPNPREYDCDFVTTVAEARTLVDAVASPGFALHLDTAAMTLAGDSPAVIHDATAPRHFHISEPYLAPVGVQSVVDHSGFARALRGQAYDGYCSIEMRAPAEAGCAPLRTALEFAASVYLDGQGPTQSKR